MPKFKFAKFTLQFVTVQKIYNLDYSLNLIANFVMKQQHKMKLFK